MIDLVFTVLAAALGAYAGYFYGVRTTSIYSRDTLPEFDGE